MQGPFPINGIHDTMIPAEQATPAPLVKLLPPGLLLSGAHLPPAVMLICSGMWPIPPSLHALGMDPWPHSCSASPSLAWCPQVGTTGCLYPLQPLMMHASVVGCDYNLWPAFLKAKTSAVLQALQSLQFGCKEGNPQACCVLALRAPPVHLPEDIGGLGQLYCKQC